MVGVGVIGAGSWGKNHVRVLAQLKGEGLIDFLAVADVNRSILAKLSKIYNIDYLTKRYEELLKLDEIDGVIISSPTPLHYRHALDALNSNKHVLVEKPLTEKVEEGEKLLEVAEKNRRILMVGFLLRYSPAIQFAKKIIEEGIIGRVLSISTKRTSFWPNRKLDVGVVRDLAIHDIDLVRFLTNSWPKLVFAIGGKLIHDYEDYASILIEFEDSNGGKIATLIEASWVTPYKIRRMEIVGDKGTVEIELLNHIIKIFKEDRIEIPNLPYREPLFEQDKNFVLSIKGAEKPLVDGYDGIIALKACVATLKSISSKSIVRVFE